MLIREIYGLPLHDGVLEPLSIETETHNLMTPAVPEV